MNTQQRIARWVLRAGAGLLLPFAVQAWAGAPTSPTAASQQPASASTPIYLSVDREGNATFADHAVPGAQQTQVRHYETGASEQSLARARAEREYWRAQSEAFARRQQAREQARAAEAMALAYASRPSPERYPTWSDLPVRRAIRGVAPVVIPGQPGAGPGAGAYRSSPGASGGAPAAFIGSGFATSR